MPDDSVPIPRAKYPPITPELEARWKAEADAWKAEADARIYVATLMEAIDARERARAFALDPDRELIGFTRR